MDGFDINSPIKWQSNGRGGGDADFNFSYASLITKNCLMLSF